MGKPLIPKPGAAEIAAMLRREITNGNLLTNDRLKSERALAAAYGVARGTIRAALNRLANAGLIETCPGSGTYVTQVANGDIFSAIAHTSPLELMDARFALEPHICRLAVMYGRKTDFDKLDALCDKMDKAAGDPAAFGANDTEFHCLLAQSTRNGLLAWIIEQIALVRGQKEWRRMRHLTLDNNSIRRYNHQHKLVLQAICQREPEKAANLMKQHLETARLSLTRVAET